MLWMFQAAVTVGNAAPGTTITSGESETLIFGLIKLLFLLAFGLYVVFAFIATRQISIMRKTVITPFSSTVTLIGYIHLAAAIFVLVAAFLFL